MYHLHLSRHLRTLAFIAVAVALLAAAGTLWWANRTGLPPSWRAAIEREIGKHGAHVRIGGLSYLPFRGLSATNIRVFSDAACTSEISRLERVLLDFDKTRLARGEIRLSKLVLNNARLDLPVNPEDPRSERLEVGQATGTLLMPGGRRLEIRNARGTIEGIEVELNARLVGYQQDGDGGGGQNPMGQRRELLARVIAELNRWHFDRSQPPRIRIHIDGDANDGGRLSSKLTLTARGVEKNGHTLDELDCEAELSGDLLTVTAIKARDGRGGLQGRVDYDIGDRHGRFDAHSSLDILALLKAWTGIEASGGVLVGGSQKIEAQGEFRLDAENRPQVHVTGRADCGSVVVRGVLFERVESLFAWRENELFLRDIRLSRPDGTATGKAMIQWPQVRLALDSNLPARVYQPFFTGQPLEKVIADFAERKGAEIRVSLEGGFDATDRHSWAYTGSGRLKNMNYKGVPLNAAGCRFSLSHDELDFFDGDITFNYQNYPLREAYKGPAEGSAKVGRIRYNAAEKTVDVEKVTGTVWAAPLVRLFAPKVADSLEVYRFHRPPELSGDGVVDVTPRGRTVLDVVFRTAGAADYRFLGENVTLTKPSGKVAIRGPKVNVSDLECLAFGGPIRARFDVNGPRLEGEMSWTGLEIPALCSTYGLTMKGGGEFTGRIDFSITGGRVETMAGEGLFALERTELFSVPIFGPLSPLISGVLNDRRAGFERAKSAFCNFTIKDGILSSRDFNTTTTSLTFAGDGEVDLAKRTIDMTMRMNARGLLGLLTLPLRPFYGMFQFRGTGPLRNPQWENVMFTAPPPEQDAHLKDPPKARIVR